MKINELQKLIAGLILLILSVLCISFTIKQTLTEEEKSVKEFNSGQTSKFSSLGEGKSQGLKINIKYPKSWQSIEGEHPHVVRKFAQSDNYALAILIVKKQEKNFTEAEINESLTTEGLKSIMPSSSTYISSNGNLKVEGLKAGSIEFSNYYQRLERVAFSYNLQYVFYYKNYFIMAHFTVINKIGESNESVESRYKNVRPLFPQMFNSIVIDNVWEK